MNMKHYIVRKCDKTLKFSYTGVVLLKLSVIVLLIIWTETVQAQGCSVVLKISDPAPVCSPSTVDLTAVAITIGSTDGLRFSYFMNTDLTIPVPSPTQASAGTYYIKGVLTGACVGFVAASIKATVIEKPIVIIPNPVIQSVNRIVDLTLPQITAGSDGGLVFSYWYDAEAKQSLPSPQSAGKGVYYIKGTAVNGCFDTKSITIND